MVLAHSVFSRSVADSTTTETLDLLLAAATPLDRSLVTPWLDGLRWLGHSGMEWIRQITEIWGGLTFGSSGAT